MILVHRMLKNAVPIPEYLLLSEAVFQRVDDRVRSRGRALEQELEGLGLVRTYFMDLAEIVVLECGALVRHFTQRPGRTW